MTRKLIYQEDMPGAAHFSCYLPANSVLEFTDTDGGANVGMMFYNPINLGERYNAPDTLKCQHTFKLTAGNCVYSDMGRVFCSIVRDDTGWIDTVTGFASRFAFSASAASFCSFASFSSPRFFAARSFILLSVAATASFFGSSMLRA